MSANDSTGVGYFNYLAGTSAIDLSAYTHVYFDWAADLAGASIEIWANIRGYNNSKIASWSSLPSTGGTTPADLQTQVAMAINWGLVDPTAIGDLAVIVNGVPNLDSSIDNITLTTIPIPPALWLFGSGLLGLVGISRRKKAS
jgi:hypothetical protein